jgi:hypothetical protein
VNDIINIKISKNSLKRHDKKNDDDDDDNDKKDKNNDDDDNDDDADDEEDEDDDEDDDKHTEMDNYLQLNPMLDYWCRPIGDSWQKLCYLEMIEYFHLEQGEGKGSNAMSNHPIPTKHWIKNKNCSRRIAAFSGRKLPDMRDRSILSQNDIDFYFKSLLILFKPHSKKSMIDIPKIKNDNETYEQAYIKFLKDPNQVNNASQAKVQEDLLMNYYRNGDESKDDEETAETKILKEHPLENPDDKDDDVIDEDEAIYNNLLDDGYDEEEVMNLASLIKEDVEINLSPEIEPIFHKNIENTPKSKPIRLNLPKFTNHDDYLKKLIDPRKEVIEDYNGTTVFMNKYSNNFKEMEILLREQYYNPIKWVNTNNLGAPIPQTIGRFEGISSISQKMRLNIWQHYVFEVHARHLLFEYTKDICKDVEEIDIQISPHLQQQLISYIGGSAGSGKSAIISSLLLFAQSWGRRDTVETMSYTGIASILIDGETLHKQRGLALFTLKSNNSSIIQVNVKKVYLTIIDETSMSGQPIIGAADMVTRNCKNPNKVWGGGHIMLLGDWLQLGPVKSAPLYKDVKDDLKDDFRLFASRGKLLWDSVNFVVFLVDVMRQKDDIPYLNLLERMRWGINTQEDIDILNTRFIDNLTDEICYHENDVDDKQIIDDVKMDIDEESLFDDSSSSIQSSSGSLYENDSFIEQSESDDNCMDEEISSNSDYYYNESIMDDDQSDSDDENEDPYNFNNKVIIPERFTPTVFSRNIERCNYNDGMIFESARSNNICIYEIIPYATNTRTQLRIRRMKYLSEQTTDKIPFLMKFHLAYQPIQITKRVNKLDKLKCISNGTIGFILGFCIGTNDDPIMLSNINEDKLDNYIIRYENGIMIKTFKNVPEYLIIKIRGSEKKYVKGFPKGVLKIPLDKYTINMFLPGAKKKITMTVHAYPIIPAYGLTPEKLQGITLNDKFYITELENRNSQTLYVTYSRNKKLSQLIISHFLTMEYVRKFIPCDELLDLVYNLMKKINIPDYLIEYEDEYQNYYDWFSLHESYYYESKRLNTSKNLKIKK